MKFIPFQSNALVPASHENPLSPGVLKKVLVEKGMLQQGRLQMINWAVLGVGKQFAPHYHEDMQEIFVLVSGEAEIRVGEESATMRRGDTILIDAGEVHQMRNCHSMPVEYLALGISRETGGKTVVVE